MKSVCRQMNVRGKSILRIHHIKYLLVFFLGLLVPGFAIASEAIFKSPGEFKIEKHCKGYTSKNRHTGEVDLKVKSIYKAYSENRPENGSHVRLIVGGKKKWASLSCGKYIGEKPPFIEGVRPDPPPPDQTCLKFFDDENNTVRVGFGGNVDITPPARPIEPFGDDVNAMCGAPGKKTSRNEFKQLMKKHPDVLADLMAFTGGKVFAGRPAYQNVDMYLEELTQAWYSVSAFDHIFCGEPKASGKLGGLHYYGRYQQLQESGKACRLPNYSKNEVIPGIIYTMGAKINLPGGKSSTHQMKGFGLTLSASDLMKVITRSFAENPTVSDASTHCILDVTDVDARFKTVFVRRSKGIRTFYPDATPANGPACSSPIVLTASSVKPEPDPICRSTTGDTKVMRVGRFQFSVTGTDDKGFNMRVTECE